MVSTYLWFKNISIPHSLTASLLTRSLSHTITHCLSHLYSPIHSLTYLPIYSLTASLTHLIMYTRPLIHCLSHCLSHSLNTLHARSQLYWLRLIIDHATHSARSQYNGTAAYSHTVLPHRTLFGSYRKLSCFLHSISSVLQLVQVFLVKGRFNEGKRARQKLVSCNDNDRDVDQLWSYMQRDRALCNRR